MRRNAKRKEALLKKKSESSKKSEVTSKAENFTQEVEPFQCHHCDYQVSSIFLMRKHMDKEHTVIPQLDGLEDLSSKENVPCPLCKGS